MARIIANRRLAATAIFDLEDAYARSLQIGETHPQPRGEIAIRLVGRVVNGQVQAFPEPLKLRTINSPSGYQLFFGQFEAPDGSLRRIVPTPEVYAVRVESQFYQLAERNDVALPQPEAAYFFDLQPGVSYPFPSLVRRSLGPTLLRGSLHQTDGTPIAGATVAALGGGQTLSYRTGADGQWVLVLPPDQSTGTVGVRIALPGAAPVTLRAGVVRGQETSVAHTGLRGWVVDARGRGIKGAVITVSVHGGQSRTDADGRWFYYFGLDQQPALVEVTATLPDGRTIRHSGQPVQPQAVTRVPTLRDTQQQ